MTQSTNLQSVSAPAPVMPAQTDWRSDTSIAYAVLRLTFGINIGLRGLMRIADGTGVFAAGLAERLAPSLLPEFSVVTFGYILPWVEASLGLLLVLGLWTRPALIVGGLVMATLTFGVMLIQDFQLAWLQLSYSLIYFLLLALRSWNALSLDARLEGSQHRRTS